MREFFRPWRRKIVVVVWTFLVFAIGYGAGYALKPSDMDKFEKFYEKWHEEITMDLADSEAKYAEWEHERQRSLKEDEALYLKLEKRGKELDEVIEEEVQRRLDRLSKKH
jgi:hypothetical protein